MMLDHETNMIRAMVRDEADFNEDPGEGQTTWEIGPRAITGIIDDLSEANPSLDPAVIATMVHVVVDDMDDVTRVED